MADEKTTRRPGGIFTFTPVSILAVASVVGMVGFIFIDSVLSNDSIKNFQSRLDTGMNIIEHPKAPEPKPVAKPDVVAQISCPAVPAPKACVCPDPVAPVCDTPSAPADPVAPSPKPRKPTRVPPRPAH
jgi:hypothetical protein